MQVDDVEDVVLVPHQCRLQSAKITPTLRELVLTVAGKVHSGHHYQQRTPLYPVPPPTVFTAAFHLCLNPATRKLVSSYC